MPAPGIMDAPNMFKGDLDSTYLAGGTDGRGLLPPAVAKEFIQATALDSDFLSDVNQDYMSMTNPEEYVDVAGFSGRVSYADVPGVPTTESQRSALTISRATLTPKWFRAACFLNYRTQRENIMRMGLGEFVKMDLTRQVRVDQEENMLIGDTTSLVDGLELFDGLVKQAATRTLDHTGSPVEVSDTPFLSTYYAMPKPFRRDKPNLRFYVSENVEAVYWAWLTQNRAGTIRANFYENEAPGARIKLNGVAVKPLSMMPDDKILFTNRMNICPGFLLQMYLENFHDPDAGVDKYFYRYATDIKFAQSSGVVLYDGVSTGITETLG
jgi:hypothetical protein